MINRVGDHSTANAADVPPATKVTGAQTKATSLFDALNASRPA